MTAKNNFYSGTSGLVMPVAKALYPPEYKDASRLTYYASLFTSIEINSSFYKMPQATTIYKWALSVPESFQFTFKLLKNVTHIKGLNFDSVELKKFMETISVVGSKRGCLLVQFPPGLKFERLNEVQHLLDEIKSIDPENEWRVAVEFRDASWYTKEVYDVLDYYHTTMVIHDLPTSASPSIRLAADFCYLRFHGPGGRYRGSYEMDFLQQYATQVAAWLRAGKDVYCYFNNTMGDAVKNLQELNRLVNV